MLNLYQHIVQSMAYEALKRIRGDIANINRLQLLRLQALPGFHSQGQERLPIKRIEY